MAGEAFGVRATCRRFGRARSAPREAGTAPEEFDGKLKASGLLAKLLSVIYNHSFQATD
jgi:hypothetical protein